MEYWFPASALTVFSSSWIFVNWAETAEMPFALTLTFFRSSTEFLRLVTLEQTAAVLLLLGLLLALLLLPVGLLLALVLLVGLLLLVLQPARNAAAATPATASALHCLAIIPEQCRIPVPAASPAPGEGQRRPQPRKAARQAVGLTSTAWWECRRSVVAVPMSHRTAT